MIVTLHDRVFKKSNSDKGELCMCQYIADTADNGKHQVSVQCWQRQACKEEQKPPPGKRPS